MKKLFLLILLMASCACFANRIYVNPLATGSNNGTSWINAYTKLSSGIELAQTGDTVLVAEGIYKNASSSGLFTYRFYQGIILLGGYPNTGNPTDAQRNWVNHPTILSGEAGTNGYTDNVVLVPNLLTPVVIDGFIMRRSGTTGLRIENAAAVDIKNTVFENNEGQTIYISNSQVSFTNCVVFNNNSDIVSNNSNANTHFYNCIIANNRSNSQVVRNLNASLAIYNSTLVNNTGIVVNSYGTGITIIKNSIFRDNRNNDKLANADIQSIDHSIQVSHCITQTYYSSNSNTLLVNYHPRFVNQLQPAGADNKFFTADDGLQLTAPCSPALNCGDNSLLGAITSDIIGKPRIYNGGTVDLGAYELQQTPGSSLKTIYVNSSAGNTGTHDGSTWTNAFTTLQQALLYCADTIKIAAGTYLTSNSERDSVFSIESGQVILGGYPATGNPTDADRDPKLYHTILMSNYPAGTTGNYSPAIKFYNCDSTTLLDGIKATNWSGPQGGATAVEVAYGSKLKITNCDFRIDTAHGIRGTGLAIYDSSAPFIYRCEFNTSASETHGSAVSVGSNSRAVFSLCNFRGYTGPQNATTALSVYNASATLDSCVFWKDNLHADVTFVQANASVLSITNCVFRAYHNEEALIYNSGNTTGTISNCTFRNYNFFADNPLVYNDNSHLIFNKCLFDSSRLAIRNINKSAPVFNNCVSVNSKFMWNQRSVPTVNNGTIVNTFFYQGAVDNSAREELVLNEDSSVFRANNTIFWSAKLNPDKKDIYDRPNLVYPQKNSTSILTNCLTQIYGTNGQNGNIVGKAPRFHRLDHILGADGKLFTADDGLQLAVCSPAVNTGNSSLGTILPTDVLANPRIVQSAIDMGAYELQQPANSAGNYYVNSTAAGNSTGTSWTDAYPDLQTALCNACADTIRVAAGTYKPAVSARDSSFVISRPLALFGGYPATGNPVEKDRNAVKHPTILSGNIGDLTDSLDNTAVVVFVNGVTDSVHIDGFVIRDGYYVSGGIGINATGGAGLNVLYTNTGIHNCRFINNHVFPYGGGCYISPNSRATVSGCIFTGNSSTNEGGALYAGGYLRLTGSVLKTIILMPKGAVWLRTQE
ncbi:MAG TPA: right-handed parallel beta-helix repeat-containing protein [Niastella sp.]